MDKNSTSNKQTNKQKTTFVVLCVCACVCVCVCVSLEYTTSSIDSCIVTEIIIIIVRIMTMINNK